MQIKEETINLEKENDNNYKNIMEKYKDYQIKDMNDFIDRLTKYLRSKTNDENCIISDWFKIIIDDGSCVDKFTFEVHYKNIFIVFGRDSCNVGKIITNICGFNNVEDLDIEKVKQVFKKSLFLFNYVLFTLHLYYYKCNKIVRETRQYE